MRRSADTISIILCLLILNLSAFSQITGRISADRELLRSANSAAGKPIFTPNQLLIKFKQTKTGTRSEDQSQSFIPSDAYKLLLKKHKVQEATQLFRETASKAARNFMRSVTSEESPSIFLKSFQAHGLENVYRVSIAAEMNVMAAIEDFRKLPEVEYAEPSYIYRALTSLNDQYLSSQQSWGQPYQDLWGLYRISAPEAWDSSTGAGVLIAVIDSGCDIYHPDLAGKIWTNPLEIPNNGYDDDHNGLMNDMVGWDFVDWDDNVSDSFGHGTHVTGIIAATGNNRIGVAGVAWRAQAMILRALNDNGEGNSIDLAYAILYAVENGARIINLSWGGTQFSQIIEDAFSIAASQNVILVAAAGNDGRYAYEYYPANSRYVITVGASDHLDNRANFSNFGDSLDVLAPGGDSSDNSPEQIYQNILSLRSSTLNGAIADPMMTVGDYYLRLSGTSMAAPYVSGLAALILQRFPFATPEDVRQVIRRAADWIPDAFEKNGWGGTNGYGRINALKSINAITLCSARIFNPSPAAAISAESVPLKITASCPDLNRWELDYYDRNMNSVSLHSSTSPHVNNWLSAWNAESVPDDSYMLRLRVINQQGDEFLDQMKIVLDRVTISSPSLNSAFRPGQAITFKGTASGGGFNNYVIQYQNLNSEEWRSDGITLTNGGTRKIRNGLLGTWNTPNIDQLAIFKVRLIVKRLDLDDAIEETQLIIDPTLHPGWPRNIGHTQYGNGFGLPYAQHLIATDIDLDGQMEIPVGHGDEVTVFRSDGTIEPGWPQKLVRESKNLEIERGPLAADLNYDGYLEIVASAQGHLFVWDYKGNLRPGFEKAYCDVESISELSPQNIELFGTRRQALVICTSSGAYCSYKGLDGFDILGTAVGDLTGDGAAEMVAVLHKDSSTWIDLFHVPLLLPLEFSGWPKKVSENEQASHFAPVLVDLNSDGQLEILFIDGDHVGALCSNGNYMRGWPVDLPPGYQATGISTADVTGDGRPEVFVALVAENGLGDSYLLFDAKGKIMPGWPIVNQYSSLGSGSAAIVDLDGDGKRELIFGSGSYLSPMPLSLHALRSDGQELPGFPKYVSDIDPGNGNTPLVLDLDNDGLLEIAWLNNSGDLYMWDTSARTQNDSLDWPMNQHDPGHTRIINRPIRKSLSIPTGSVAAVSTYGSAGQLQIGYARGDIVRGVSTPYGTAVFSYTRNNVTVSETAVPVSPPTLKSRIFVDHRINVAAMPGYASAGFLDIQTGLAVVNCGTNDASVTYTLRDAAGTILVTGRGNLAQGAHFAKFVDQLAEVAPDFKFPSDFSTAVQFGSLDIESNQPLSLVALRLIINQRNDPIMTSTPIADLTSSPGGDPIFFPQFADGGGYLSTLTLINTSSSVESGVLKLYGEDGSPLTVNQFGGERGSEFRYTIPASGVLVFQTDGAPFTANTGSVQLLPDANTTTPVSSGFFSFLQRDTRVFETGVPASVPTTHLHLFIDMSQGHNTGIALTATGGSPTDLNIQAFQLNGVIPAGTEKTIRLNPHEHQASFVDELVGGLPEGFIGVLDISSNHPFAAIALRCLINERGDFLTSTYPNADMTRSAPPEPFIFPQIAAGDGYTTQFFFLSSGGSNTVELNFFSDTGAPLAVGK
jgi:subtilisin family serine protease